MKLCAVPIFLWASTTHAQTTLAPVAPPTDWLGVGIVSAIGIVAIAVVAYIVHIKRTPGAQFGEEFYDGIAAAIDRRRGAVPPHPVPQAPPLTLDDITFESEVELERYKVAKAIVDSHRKEAP